MFNLTTTLIGMTVVGLGLLWVKTLKAGAEAKRVYAPIVVDPHAQLARRARGRQ